MLKLFYAHRTGNIETIFNLKILFNISSIKKALYLYILQTETEKTLTITFTLKTLSVSLIQKKTNVNGIMHF